MEVGFIKNRYYLSPAYIKHILSKRVYSHFSQLPNLDKSDISACLPFPHSEKGSYTLLVKAL